MFASARAGNVEQSPLGFVDFIEFSLVRRVGDALVQRQDALITRHHDYGAEFESLGEVHRRCGDGITFSNVCQCRAGTRNEIWGADENAHLVSGHAIGNPFGDRFTHYGSFVSVGGKCFDLGWRSIEHRDNASPLVLQAINVPQNDGQQMIRCLPYLLRGAVTDFKRV